MEWGEVSSGQATPARIVLVSVPGAQLMSLGAFEQGRQTLQYLPPHLVERVSKDTNSSKIS